MTQRPKLTYISDNFSISDNNFIEDNDWKFYDGPVDGDRIPSRMTKTTEFARMMTCSLMDWRFHLPILFHPELLRDKYFKKWLWHMAHKIVLTKQTKKILQTRLR
jgi:hypothetical protein